MTIWLARHAETATPTLFHGAESDVELGEHGQRQALAAAEWFATQQPTVVISSAMIRASDTAAPIAARCAVPHLIEPQLYERRVGPLSRKPRAEAEQIWNETNDRWQRGETAFAFPGMESFDELRDRTVPVFTRIASTYPAGRVVIICHGVVCKVLLVSLLKGRGPGDWNTIGRIPNLAMSELVSLGSAWETRQLLMVPPPVLAVNELAAANPLKTEA